MKKKIAVVIGTRPEAVKLIPVYFAFRDSEDFSPVVINTGQHVEMVDQIFRFFGVEPDAELKTMTGNQSLHGLTATLVERLGELVSANDFFAVMVQGDTTSAFVAALVGFYHQLKVIHVEAGLRTGERYSPFPEEMNRKLIGGLADVHFCPTARAVAALRREGITENVFNVGNTVVDSLFLTGEKVKTNESDYAGYFGRILDLKKRIVLITGHRRENFGDKMRNVCEAILELSARYEDYEFVYPVHLNPNIQQPVGEILAGRENIHLLPPLAYDAMIYLMSKSHIILTDSGGVQEEAPSFGKPILVLRDTTERPEGIAAGCAVLVGTDKGKIISAFDALINDADWYSKMSRAKNPYGDGKSAARILEECRRLFD